MMLRSSNSIVLLTVILASLCLLSAGQTRKCVKVLMNFEKKCIERGLEFPGCDVHQNKLSERKMRKCGKQAKRAKKCGFSCALKAIDGGYTEFSAWSACSVPCGGGQQTRSRTCTNPAPSNGGKGCVGKAAESQNCNDKECPASNTIEDGSRISILGAHGKYLRANSDGSVTCSETEGSAAGVEVEVVVTGENTVALKSIYGKYLSAQSDGSLQWNRDAALGWEGFTWREVSPGVYSLKSTHGKFMSAQPNGAIAANRDAEQSYERFTVAAF